MANTAGRGSESSFRHHTDKLHTLNVLLVGGCGGQRLMRSMLLAGLPRLAARAPASQKKLKVVENLP